MYGGGAAGMAQRRKSCFVLFSISDTERLLGFSVPRSWVLMRGVTKGFVRQLVSACSLGDPGSLDRLPLILEPRELEIRDESRIMVFSVLLHISTLPGA